MKMYIIFISVLTLGATGFLYSQCCSYDARSQTSDQEISLVSQKTCPVMGGTINRDLYVEQDGKRIYVCCAGCLETVEKEFNKQVARLEQLGEKPEKVTEETATEAKKQTTCPVMEGRAVNRDLFVDYQGQRIYVCCGGCVRQVRADPEKYLEKLTDAGIEIEKID